MKIQVGTYVGHRDRFKNVAGDFYSGQCQMHWWGEEERQVINVWERFYLQRS